MTMHLSTLPRPGSEADGPTRSIARCNMRLSAGYNVALISDDLPAPDTPVTATITPSGISTVTLRRLCSRAPASATPLDGAGRPAGTSMRSAPDRSRPVGDDLARAISAG